MEVCLAAKTPPWMWWDGVGRAVSSTVLVWKADMQGTVSSVLVSQTELVSCSLEPEWPCSWLSLCSQLCKRGDDMSRDKESKWDVAASVGFTGVKVLFCSAQCGHRPLRQGSLLSSTVKTHILEFSGLRWATLCEENQSNIRGKSELHCL